MQRILKMSDAILETTDQMMEQNSAIYLMGLGVTDPKGIYGTTLNLVGKYGKKRVVEMPTSENALLGVAIGSAIVGMRPIITHQRVDFFLLAIDQLINNAAKWHFMFGGKMRVPLVIRLIVGRGWGQGPQHSQALHSLFAHVPGLKVVLPSNAYDAKGLLISAIEDDNPVIYLEHRWLHDTTSHVPLEIYRIPLGLAKVVQKGTDLTVIASSQMTLEAIKAIDLLREENLSIELIDLRSLKPLDEETICTSVAKTGNVLVLDNDWKMCGFGAEIVSMIVEKVFSKLKRAPRRVGFPDSSAPTSWALANHFYPTSTDIAIHILEMMDLKIKARQLLKTLIAAKMEKPLDVPDSSFTGPF